MKHTRTSTHTPLALSPLPDTALIELHKYSRRIYWSNYREAAHAWAAWVLNHAEALVLGALACTLAVVLQLRRARTRRRLAEAMDQQPEE